MYMQILDLNALFGTVADSSMVTCMDMSSKVIASARPSISANLYIGVKTSLVEATGAVAGFGVS